MAAGDYLPSFFEIYIDTDENLNSLAELSPHTQGLYHHEYCHFIQDVTTTFGILKTWNVYDRLRQFVFSIQHEAEVIHIPLHNEERERQQRYLDFIQRLIGSQKVLNRLIDDKFDLVEVNLSEDPEINEMIPGLNAQHVHLTVRQPDLPDKIYRFGERAISEGMVYLIESKFYTLPKPSRYPYLIAQELARFIFPVIADSNELLFALCDIALMHPMPGWAYFHLLNRMKAENLIPESGRALIDFGRNEYVQLGWNIAGQVETAINATEHISQQLYGHPHFEKTLQWFQTIVLRGHSIRRENPYFFLDLYKDDTPLGGHFAFIWYNLGGPHCINRNFERSMRPPAGMEADIGRIHPQHLRISWQLNRFLLNGRIDCQLQDVCRHSEPNVTDDRCEEHPWRRIEDAMGCPYAAAWVIYGFHERQFLLGEIQIPEAT